jgi:hypothetical protein
MMSLLEAINDRLPPVTGTKYEEISANTGAFTGGIGGESQLFDHPYRQY